MALNPVVRVVCFLLFAVNIAFANTAQLLSGALLVAALYLGYFPSLLPRAVAMVRRLRILFLSLFVCYLFFTPGQSLVAVHEPLLAALSPTWQGLYEGGLRAAILVLLVFAVNLLLATTTQAELFAALDRLASPLKLVGISTERFTVRAVLVVDKVEQVRGLVARALQDQGRPRPGMTAVAGFFAEVYQQVLDRAEQEGCVQVTRPVLPAIAPLQWTVPVALAVLFYAGRWVADI